jgi:hypothetical protein
MTIQMNKKEFLEKAVSIQKKYRADNTNWFTPWLEEKLQEKLEDKTDNILSCCWEAGSFQGVSCWGGGSEHISSFEKEPAMWGFHELLELVAPDLNWKDYLEVRKKIIHEFEVRDGGYYGDQEIYITLYFDANDLWKEINLVRNKKND